MTTRTVHARRTAAPATVRVRFADLMRSEWIKLRTVPSTVLAFAAVAAIGLGGSLFLALTLESSGAPSTPSVPRTMSDLVAATVIVGQLVAGVIGVLSTGSEYSSGTIRSTLLSSPSRLAVLLAKSVVVFATVAGTAFVTVLALVGAAVHLGCCALVGLGLATLFRSTAAGVIGVFVLTIVGQVLVALFPAGELAAALAAANLGYAGEAMSRVPEGPMPFMDLEAGLVSPAAGGLVAFAWVAVTLAAGALALTRRDA